MQKELDGIKKHRETQRSLREKTKIPTFALIGYTNVGNSTLLNALTQADVFVEDKLFATLDPTVRKFTLPNRQNVLLIDTVGFIRKIPHQLVAAFRSTLEEAVQADILLHIVDVSHPQALEQAAATYEVLKELHALNKPILTVLNKTDQAAPLMVHKMKIKYPKTVCISALKEEGFEELYQKMVEEMEELRCTVKLKVPQDQYALVSQILQEGTILSCEYIENDIFLEAKIPKTLSSKVSVYNRLT